MAKYGKTLAQVVVEINGKQQVQQVLKAMEDSAAKLRTQINAAKSDLEELAKSGSSPQYDAKKKELSGLQKELNQLTRAMRETKKLNEDVGTILDHMSDYSITSLNKAKRSLTSLMSSIVPNTKKAQQQIETIRKAIQQVTDEIERRKGGLTEFSDIMGNLGKATPHQLDMVEKRLKSLLGSVTENSKAWRKYNKELGLVQEEKAGRKKSEMEAQMGNVSKLSVNARNELKKYWQAVNDDSKQGSKAFRESLDYLRQIEEAEKKMAADKAAKVMAKPQNYSVNELNEAIKVTEQLQADTKNKKDWADYAQQIAQAKVERDKFADTARMKAMSEQFKHLKDLSASAYEEQRKYWEEVKRTSQEGTDEYNKASANLEKMQKLEQSRLKKQATDVQKQVRTGTYKGTIEETEKAIALQEKYKKSLDTTDAKAIKAVDDAIRGLRENLSQVSREDALKAITTGLGSSSTDQIKQSIDLLTKYRNTLTDRSAGSEWEKLGKDIQEADNYLKGFLDTGKMQAMSSQFSRLRDLSASALAEQKKYWEGIRDSAETSTSAYQDAVDKLKEMKQLEAERLKDEARQVIGDVKSGTFKGTIEENKQAIELMKKYQQMLDTADAAGLEEVEETLKGLNANLDEYAKKTSRETLTTNLMTSGTSDIKKSVEWLTKYQGTLEPLSKEWKDINDEITAGNERLKQVSVDAKVEAMTSQFASLKTISSDAFNEQKKFWEGIRDSVVQTDPLYKTAIDNLEQMKQLEDERTRIDAKQAIAEVNSGTFDKTIEETQQAIKLIEEYKKQLHTQSEAPAIEEANEAIEILNRNLGKAKEALMDVSQAKSIAADVASGEFNGTSEDIDKARKSLEDYRKSLKLVDDAKEVEKVDKALSDLARSAELGGKNLKTLDEVLGDLKSASVDDLKTAAKQLQEELQKATRGTKEYADTAADLRRVNRELERARKEWEGQESLFVRMTKRLSVYMAAYGSLSFIIDKIKELGRSNLQLSDSIADVAKTTGLEAKELALLGKEIRAIDTRTAQEQLYELAAAAGQLGIKSETEIAGFVRAANMITVSLNELGTEATTQLMKIATLTGEAQNGTEKALLSIGSAINELTASSAAAAGPIVDLMNRMGGIAAQSGITSAQMAAIGATADALGQSVEITGTSMNKFLATLMSNSDQIAYALNMDAKALRSFINEGRTMDAVVAVFEKMNDMGGLGKLAPIMGELGSEGARMTQVLAAMAEKVDFLKSQLDISTKAYDEAVSIQNEYNVKNENAIAILQRMGNAIKEFFVNNMVVDVITAVLRAMYQFFSFLSEGTVWAKSFAFALVSLTTALVSTRIQWVRTINEMNRMDVFRAILLGLKNLTAGTIAWSNAWKNFGKVLKANWFSILIGAIAGVATWIYKTATYVSEATKATAKYNRELQEEKDKVDRLFGSLKRLSNTEADRARVINSINQQYGQYLGFMLDEKDSAEKLAAAHQLINAELRKRMALNLQNTLTGKANNEYAENLEKTIASIGKKVENIRVRITKENGQTEDRELYTSDVMNTISEMINDRVYESVKVTQEEVNGQIVYKQKLEGVDLNQLKEDIRDALVKEFENVQMYDANGNIINGDKSFTGRLVFGNVESYIENMLNERIKYQKAIITAEEQANIELRSATKSVLKGRQNMIDQLASEIDTAKENSKKLEQNLSDADKALKSAEAAADKFAKDDNSKEAKTARKNLSEAQENYAKEEKILKDHYNKIADNAYDYVDSQKAILKEHYSNVDAIRDENLKQQRLEERDAINQQIEEYTKIAKQAAEKVPGFDPWDKGRDVKDWREFSDIVTNLDTSSAKALAAAFKKIKDEAALFPDDVQSIYDLFQSQGVDKISLEKLGLTDAKSVADLVFDWEKQIKDKLKNKFHRNTTLGFIFEEGNDRDMKARVRQDYQAAMAALEAYYKEYEDFYRQQKENLGLTDETLNQQILENDRKFNEDRQQLIKKFLGEQSTFDPTKYIGKLSKYNYFGDKDLDEMSKQYQEWGDAMTDGGRNQIAKSGLKIREALNKEKRKIYDLLADKQYVQQATKEMQDAFEKLNTTDDNGGVIGNFLWGNTPMEKRTQEEANRRMAVLMEFSEDVYAEEAESFKKRLREHSIFGNSIKGMDEEEYAAFLVLLQQFHDKVISAEKRHADERKRIIDQQWEEEGYQNGYNAADRTISIAEENLSTMQNAGAIAREQEYFDQYQQLVLNRVALEQWAYEQKLELYKKNNATQEQFQELDLEHSQKQQQFQQQLLDNYIARYQKMADVTTSYGNIIGDGFGRMIAGEEDAGKQLIKNLLTETIQMASQFAQRLILQSTFGAQMESIRATQNAAQLSAAYATAMSEVGIEASKMAAIEAIAAGEITAQSMAQPDSIVTFGATGAARAAVIIGLVAAATAAALALVNSLFPDSKASETKNRKLSTGMLTYAEGNYPVLGNDGKVYDAKYEGAGMKTGIYGGGAHFGIFSEKQPEMIVDGKTTQKLILNYPYIYDAITTIAKNGRLVNAMPTFAAGDYPAGMKSIAKVEAVDIAGGTSEQMTMMQEELAQSREVNRRLLKVLEGGLVAHVDGLENYKQQKKNERFLKRRGID